MLLVSDSRARCEIHGLCRDDHSSAKFADSDLVINALSKPSNAYPTMESLTHLRAINGDGIPLRWRERDRKFDKSGKCWGASRGGAEIACSSTIGSSGSIAVLDSDRSPRQRARADKASSPSSTRSLVRWVKLRRWTWSLITERSLQKLGADANLLVGAIREIGMTRERDPAARR
jgi:hypothetical protein